MLELFRKISTTSEGNYSLKEMRTPQSCQRRENIFYNVGRKLLSERDENNALVSSLKNIPKRMSEGNYSLKEMRTPRKFD